jgi:membrane-associated HD superfamily phosphohydrolase
MEKNNYRKFYLMHIASLIVMFVVMYVMVDTIDHIYINVNKLYMALLMVAPMAILKLFFMKSMYKNKLKNWVILATSALIIIIVFTLVRVQGLVYNVQFLKSMIPHHSSAILMCQEADIDDQEIKDLCKEIVETQKREIRQMEDILQRLT